MAVERGMASDGRPHADLTPESGQSIFEAIEQSGRPDEETYIPWRGEHVFAILNVFPYTSGHLMVLPKRAVPCMEELNAEEFDELWSAVRSAVIAVKAAFHPHGLNVGINDGLAGGGSIPEHMHVHVVPRWQADTNFTATTANTRLLPLPLVDTWKMIRDAWPSSASG